MIVVVVVRVREVVIAAELPSESRTCIPCRTLHRRVMVGSLNCIIGSKLGHPESRLFERGTTKLSPRAESPTLAAGERFQAPPPPAAPPPQPHLHHPANDHPTHHLPLSNYLPSRVLTRTTLRRFSPENLLRFSSTQQSCSKRFRNGLPRCPSRSRVGSSSSWRPFRSYSCRPRHPPSLPRYR